MKNGFLLYYTQYETVKLLTQEEKGELLDAIFQFNNGGISFTMSQKVELVFSMIKTQFKIDGDKYEEIKKIRSELGRKGGKASGEARSKQTKQKLHKGSKSTVNDNVNDNDNVNEKVVEVIKDLKEGDWITKKYPDIDLDWLELEAIKMLDREKRNREVKVWKSFADNRLKKGYQKQSSPDKADEVREQKQKQFEKEQEERKRYLSSQNS